MQQLHPKAKWLFFWSYIVGLTFIFVPLSVYVFLAIFSLYKFGVSYIFMILIPFLFLGFSGFFVIFLYFWATWTYRNYKYQLTEDTVKIEKGVIAKHYVSIPYERVQNVDIHRGLVARLLGLSSLKIQTAGYSGYILSEGLLPGLDPQIAEQLREELIRKVKGTKQGL